MLFKHGDRRHQEFYLDVIKVKNFPAAAEATCRLVSVMMLDRINIKMPGIEAGFGQDGIALCTLSEGGCDCLMAGTGGPLVEVHQPLSSELRPS